MGDDHRRDARIVLGIFGPITALFVVLLFFQYGNYRTNKRRLEEQLFKQQDLITSMAASRIQSYVHDIIEVLDDLGARLASTGDRPLQFEMVGGAYDELAGKVDGVAFFDANGDKIHSVFNSETLRALPSNARYEDYFSTPKQTAVTYISPIVKVKGGDEAIFISCPVRSQRTGAFIGVVLAQLSRPTFSRLCETLNGIDDQVRFLYYDQLCQQICMGACCSSNAGPRRKEMMSDTVKAEIVGSTGTGGKGGGQMRVLYWPMQVEGYRWYLSSEIRMDRLEGMARSDFKLMSVMAAMLAFSLTGGGIYLSRIYMAKARAETEAARQAAIAASAGALAAEKDKLREVMNTIPEGIMLLDGEGGILDANMKMKDILGLAGTGTLAQVADSAKAHDLLGPLESGREMAIGDRSYKIISTPVKGADGGSLREVRVLRDVTVEKSLEQKRADLVSMITHDVKSPLTVILGITGWLKGDDMSGGLPEEVKSGIGTIRSAAARVLSLMDNFLFLSSVEGMRKLEKAPVNLNALLNRALREFSLEARQRNIKLDCSFAEHSPVVQVDENQMMRAVANLLSNAIKYTPEGGSVDVVARNFRDYITVSVTDNGPGIAGKDMPRIFERHFRGKTVRHIPKGSGLGLAIVKAVVEAHGGEVDVSSEEGRGATFTLRLPVSGVNGA